MAEDVTYTIPNDGDPFERAAWHSFLAEEFPAYEAFWQRHVVPLTNRPVDIQLKNDGALKAAGRSHEDLAIAQLHYTVLRHLVRAHTIRVAGAVDESALFVGLSTIVGAHDVAFEVLERYTHRGVYDPWLESRPRGQTRGSKAGQDAQAEWKKAHGYPLQHIRDYRNKLVHGRTPPSLLDANGVVLLPAPEAVSRYCDWRTVTAQAATGRLPLGDFMPVGAILDMAWATTIDYLQKEWERRLL